MSEGGWGREGRKRQEDVPGGPVIKTLCFYCRGTGSALVRELRSHKPHSMAKERKGSEMTEKQPVQRPRGEKKLESSGSCQRSVAGTEARVGRRERHRGTGGEDFDSE